MSDGWAEMIAGLNSVTVAMTLNGARAGALASAAVRKTSLDIEADSKVFCPVDTGNLMNSIGFDIEGDGRSGAIESQIGPTADYGAHVEFGVVGSATGDHAPQAYMGPAFDRHAHELGDALGHIADGLLGG